MSTLFILSGCAHGRNLYTAEIAVVSREEGSGTRSAFAALTGMDLPGGDRTVETAEISNSTAVVMLTVAGDPAAIGYVSLGSLSNQVKALEIDGAFPSEAAIQAGSYGLYRPFSVCVREDHLTPLAQDFLHYLTSRQAQAVITAEGYIPPAYAPTDYTPDEQSGSLSISGSTSVAAVMEVLAQHYRALHPNVTIDLQQTGSGAGIAAALEGTCDIGMSSRALQESELAQGLTEIQLALDGIAVIVNHQNPLEDVSIETLQQIFTGAYTHWPEIPSFGKERLCNTKKKH